VRRGAAFQLINPKGWFFAFAVVAGFTPSERSLLTDAMSLGIIACVVAATGAGWALGGSALSRALATDRARRIAGLALGLLLVGSVVLLWL
jgi:threonine/homoserine/homoserine lactone efflux protein